MIRVLSLSDVDAAAALVRKGGLLAYPTEAVFGLGCDPCRPSAVGRLHRLKQRDPAQGFLLIAASESQLDPFVEWSALSPCQLDAVRVTWPGPVTWVLPRRRDSSSVIAGAHQGIAVRVTAHDAAATLCRALGSAIVSTSANLHGREPARSVSDVQRQFAGSDLDAILSAPLGGLGKPTEIRNAMTDEVVRSGGLSAPDEQDCSAGERRLNRRS